MTPTTAPQGISTLVRSRTAMLTLSLGVGLIALGFLLGGLFFAVSPGYARGAAGGLYRSYQWLDAAGLAVIFVGVAGEAWSAFLDQRWLDVGELAGALVATLLIAVGALVLAASQVQPGGDVIEAVGIGLWALLLVYRAGRSSLSERGSPTGAVRRGPLWVVAAAAVLLLAIGEGLSSTQASSTTPFVVAFAFLTVGLATLVICLSIARAQRFLYAPEFPNVAAGLWLLAGAQLVSAITYAVAFGPNSTITSQRVGLAIPLFLSLAAAAALGAAALQRGMSLTAEAPET